MSNDFINMEAKQAITKANARRHYSKWTKEYDSQLISMLGEKTYVQIGIEMGRTYKSIRERVNALKFRGVIDRDIITVPWQPSEVQGFGQYTIKELEQRVQNYNEKYKRACLERDGFREQMLTAQEQERRVRKQVSEMQADFQSYKIAGARLGMERNQLVAENEAHRDAIGVMQADADNSRKQAAELTTRNQELVASGRVMEDSLKTQAARLRLAESENDRLRRTAIEIKRKTSMVIAILIVFVSVVTLGGLML